MKNFKGFTLIELLVVVIIFAVLVTLGISKYRDYKAGTSPESAEGKETLGCEDGHRVLRDGHSTRQLYGKDGNPQKCTAQEE